MTNPSSENRPDHGKAPTPGPTPGDVPKPGPKPGGGPKPGPKPGGGPVPGPKPGSKPAPPAAPAAPRPTDPHKWGRIDDDGTVYVRTSDGERRVGAWQAGSAEEGLAHFGRRFDDLATEVALLEARLRTHPEEAAAIRTAALAHRKDLPTAAVVGDIESLDARLAALSTETDGVEAEEKDRKAARTRAAIARKEELAAEAEEIAKSSEQWKAAGDRLREILAEWKTIKGIDRKTDDALWKRYSRARDDFNRRRGSHFAELDRNRAAAKRAKEDLVVRAEALQHETDWNAGATGFRALMDEWKAAGRAPREADDALWARFKKAQDTFFDARHAAAAEQDAEFEANAAAKVELLETYEPRIDPEKDLDGARSALRTLQEKWEAIGKVPRSRLKELEGRIRRLEKSVSEAAEVEWRRTDPEVKARANQFWERVHGFEEQAEKAEAAGKTKDAEQARAQAAQWREWAEAAEGAVDSR